MPDEEDLVELLVGGGVRVSEVGLDRPTLEEVVLAVTSAGNDRVADPGQP